jgi:quinol monooxygenase YgiN
MTYEIEIMTCNPLERFWLIPRRMVISTLRIVPSPKQRFEVLEVLLSVLGPTEIQPGCLSCCVYEEKGPDHAVVFGAHWETEEALHEHICSDFYRRLLVACELSKRPPEVCFHHVSATQGMDLIEQLRGRGGECLPATPEAPAGKGI